jgi:uncharacterized protein (DUF1330 family)
MLVGLNILDDSLYQSYREAMSPILNEHGGGFGYDFKVAETLKSESEEKINRVFTIHFPSKERMELFFSDENYHAAKSKFFKPSVGATIIISEYQRVM